MDETPDLPDLPDLPDPLASPDPFVATAVYGSGHGGGQEAAAVLDADPKAKASAAPYCEWKDADVPPHPLLVYTCAFRKDQIPAALGTLRSLNEADPSLPLALFTDAAGVRAALRRKGGRAPPPGLVREMPPLPDSALPAAPLHFFVWAEREADRGQPLPRAAAFLFVRPGVRCVRPALWGLLSSVVDEAPAGVHMGGYDAAMLFGPGAAPLFDATLEVFVRADITEDLRSVSPAVLKILREKQVNDDTLEGWIGTDDHTPLMIP